MLRGSTVSAALSSPSSHPPSSEQKGRALVWGSLGGLSHPSCPSGGGAARGQLWVRSGELSPAQLTAQCQR